MSDTKTEQEEMRDKTPYPEFGPTQLLQASNLMYQKRNVELEYADKTKDWQIRGLTGLPDEMDKRYTQREAALAKSVGFLEGAFGGRGGLRVAASFLRYAVLALFIAGGYLYLQGNPQIEEALLSKPNIYYIGFLVVVVILGSLYFVTRIRRSQRQLV